MEVKLERGLQAQAGSKRFFLSFFPLSMPEEYYLQETFCVAQIDLEEECRARRWLKA